MSNLSAFLTYFTAVASSVIDYALIIALVVILGVIIITGLIKDFNPEIDTTEQAIKYLISETEKELEEDSTTNDLSFIEDLMDKMRGFHIFNLLLMPIFGMGLVLMFYQWFPRPAMIDSIITHYIPALPYIAMFCALYLLGEIGITAILGLIMKTGELITATKKIIKEEKEAQ